MNMHGGQLGVGCTYWVNTSGGFLSNKGPHLSSITEGGGGCGVSQGAKDGHSTIL